MIPGPSDYLRSFALSFLAGVATTLVVAAYGRLMRAHGARSRSTALRT
jgi:hypothetical protein